VRRHIKSNNVILYAVLVKLRRRIAAVAVKDKEAIGSTCTRRRITVKVLNLFNTKLVYCLAVV
jgi:hypothetical protein